MNKIDEYIDDVCKQIRSKKIHKFIKTELENHIIEQKNAFIQQGSDEETALKKSIDEMGDPISVGSQLDRIHRPKPELSIIFLTMAMISIGLIINIFIIKNNNFNNNTILELFKSIIIGSILLFIIYFIDYSIIGKYPKTLLLGFIILYLVLAISQLTFLFVPLYAGVVYSLRGRGYLGVILSALTIIFLAPISAIFSLGPFIHFFISCIMVFTIAILKDWFNVDKKVLCIVCMSFIIFISLILIFGLTGANFRLSRIKMFIDPYQDPLGRGYQSVMLKEIIKHSQFIGAFKPFKFSNYIISPENSSGFLPESSNLIITYLISKFGFIASIIIILIFITLIIRLFILSFKQKSSLGFIISFSCTSIIFLQAIIYIIINLGFIPYTSGGLPLISSGINLISNMCLIGILLSVFRNDSFVKDKMIVKGNHSNLSKKILGLIIQKLNYLNDKYYS